MGNERLTADCYLVLEKWATPSHPLTVMSVHSSEPPVGRKQAACRIKISVPRSLFDRDIPQVSVDIPAPPPSAPDVEISAGDDSDLSDGIPLPVTNDESGNTPIPVVNERGETHPSGETMAEDNR